MESELLSIKKHDFVSPKSFRGFKVLKIGTKNLGQEYWYQLNHGAKNTIFMQRVNNGCCFTKNLGKEYWCQLRHGTEKTIFMQRVNSGSYFMYFALTYQNYEDSCRNLKIWEIVVFYAYFTDHIYLVLKFDKKLWSKIYTIFKNKK